MFFLGSIIIIIIIKINYIDIQLPMLSSMEIGDTFDLLRVSKMNILYAIFTVNKCIHFAFAFWVLNDKH